MNITKYEEHISVNVATIVKTENFSELVNNLGIK